jgi:DNA-directed RNA polymerase specialized sigma24 family protein
MLTGGNDVGRGWATPPTVQGLGGWSDLVQRFAPFVHAAAVRGYGLAEDDAREVFQEVFECTWARLAKPDAAPNLQDWIVHETRRVAASRGGPEPADDGLCWLEDALAVREGIRRLPAEQREIAHRFMVERQDLRTVAEAVGRDVGPVADEVRRARRRLRRELDDVRRRRAAR